MVDDEGYFFNNKRTNEVLLHLKTAAGGRVNCTVMAVEPQKAWVYINMHVEQSRESNLSHAYLFTAKPKEFLTIHLAVVS